MTVSTNIGKLERTLSDAYSEVDRLTILQDLVDHYLYTHLSKAQKFLEEQKSIFKIIRHDDQYRRYLIQSAILENHLYNYLFADALFVSAIEDSEKYLQADKRIELLIDYLGTCINLSNQNTARDLILEINQYLTTEKNNRLQCYAFVREGFFLLQTHQYERASDIFNKALNCFNPDQKTNVKDFYFLSMAHSGLGHVYDHTQDIAKAKISYGKAVQLCEAENISVRLSWHYLHLGNCYLSEGNYDEAIVYFSKASGSKDDISRAARAAAFANLGICAFHQKYFEQSLEFLSKAEDAYQEANVNDYKNNSVIQNWRAKVYVGLGDHEKAMHHFLKASEQAMKQDDFHQQAQICRDISDYFKQRNDYKSAFEYLSLHNSFLSKAQNEINQRMLMEISIKYETERKEKETELLRLQATELQLKALRAQMNPHFMYNALNSIQNFITSYEVTSAAQYLAKFAKLMRQSLDYSELQVISLEKEIAFLEDFLYINQKLRFNDMLEYKVIIDDDLEDDIIGVPPMIVQPYVENAIEHGLRTRKQGKVTVSIEPDGDDMLLVSIEDDGIGRNKALAMQADGIYGNKHQSRGTGITEERLALLKTADGQQGGVTIIDLLDDITGEPKGTRVIIHIPIQLIRR